MSDTRTPRLVLVEDDVALSAALRYLLEIEGYVVETFDSAESMFTWEPRRREIACVVLDQRLGAGMTGVEALEQLRSLGVTAPAILITTQAGTDVRERVEAAGGVVMDKPILGDRLVRMIRACVAASPGNTPR